MPDLARNIIKSAGVKKAGLTIRFSSDQESRSATPHHVDLSIGDQKQAVISHLSCRHYLSQLALEKVNALTDEFLALTKEFIALSEADKYKEANDIKTKMGEVKKQLDEHQEIDKQYSGEEVAIKPESEFWRHWWKCTRNHIREKLDHEGVWLYRTKEGKENTDDKADFFERLDNYQFEDAVKDLGNALRDLNGRLSKFFTRRP